MTRPRHRRGALRPDRRARGRLTAHRVRPLRRRREPLRGDRGPFWAHDGRPPAANIIRLQGCSCAGLVNLMRRQVGLPVPGIEQKRNRYAGGTAYWFEYLKKRRALRPFNISEPYPQGTLLLRAFRNEIDQGHLAIIYSDHFENVLYAKLIHSYPLGATPRPGRKVLGGVKIDPTIGSSHFWRPLGFYTHACLPENWLG